MRGSHVEEAEIIPGIYTLVDESCNHPLPAGGTTGPDRPCEPCAFDYHSRKPTEVVTPRALDRPIPLDYRLKTGWRMLNPWERWA
jgi:hypothetical protein